MSKDKVERKPMIYCDDCGRLKTHPKTAEPVDHVCH